MSHFMAKSKSNIYIYTFVVGFWKRTACKTIFYEFPFNVINKRSKYMRLYLVNIIL